jgi:Sigma-70 region 2
MPVGQRRFTDLGGVLRRQHTQGGEPQVEGLRQRAAENFPSYANGHRALGGMDAVSVKGGGRFLALYGCEGTKMDYEQQVRRASVGDVKAFVELTRQFQHMAFGAALALLKDFHQAEDVVQEAFLAAWSALPTLANPVAFPGWLRGIVRHQAFRVLRKSTLQTVPLAQPRTCRPRRCWPITAWSNASNRRWH